MLTPRFLASVILWLSVPILFMKYPWFIGMIKALTQTISEMELEGSPSYVEERNLRYNRQIFALTLYSLGIGALVGLIGIAQNIFTSKPIQFATWVSVIVTSVGYIIFELLREGYEIDRFYPSVLMVIALAITLTATCALFCMRRRNVA